MVTTMLGVWIPRSIVVEHPKPGEASACSVIRDEDGCLWLQEPSGTSALLIIRADRVQIVDDVVIDQEPAPRYTCGPTTGCGKQMDMVVDPGWLLPAWTLPPTCPNCGQKNLTNIFLLRGSQPVVT